MNPQFESNLHEATPQAISEAAQETLIDSDNLAPTADNISLVAEVTATIGETGLVEGARAADRLMDDDKATDVLRAAGRTALRVGTADRQTLHDLVVLLTSGHSGKYYQTRRQQNIARRQTELELTVRRTQR